MTPARFDLVGIGNAIVDVVATADDEFLFRHEMRKGTMRLISAEEAESIYAAMPAGQETSGGSAANTCAVAAGLGAKTAFLGKVADDQLGEVFRHDIVAAGVHYPTPGLVGQAPTARCLIMVTPDAQRTMHTYLGACVDFTADDLDEDVVRDSAVVYLEGYLFDPPAAQAAFLRAAQVAHEAGRKVALSLSDAFCVDRHRDAFRALVAGHIDLLFANETEICSLYEDNEFDGAAEKAARDVPLAALTRSALGSVILHGGAAIEIDSAPARVVDTTGAGDAYAGGFLAGYTQGRELAQCGRLGSLAAACVIEHFGARPVANFISLMRQLD